MAKEDEGLERRGTVQIVTIDTEKFIAKFIKQLSENRTIIESEDDRRRPAFITQQIIANLTVKILRIWCGIGNLVMAIYSEEAMKLDFKRKIQGILETVRTIANSMSEEQRTKLAELEKTHDREEQAKLLTEVNMLNTEISVLADALQLTLDGFMGALQANLPIDLMPNVIKSHMGHVTT